MFIPELVFLDDTFKSNPNDQAELFNIYFYKQFSEASNYDANKAMGPDKINGRVLKNCSISLSTPLSILFEKCYNSSLIADE